MGSVAYIGKRYTHEILQAEKYGWVIISSFSGDLIPENRENHSVAAKHIGDPLTLSKPDPFSGFFMRGTAC